MEELDQKRAVVGASISDAEKRLVALKSQEACTLPPPPAPSDASSEVQRLQEIVSQLQAKLDAQGQDPDVPCVPTVKRFCRSGQGHVQVPFMPNSIQIVRRCRTSDGDHRWHVLVKVRVAVSREAWYGYRGQRVGEACHPGPMRRLRRSADVRNVFPRLTTQSTVADSDDDRPLVHVSSLHHEVTDVVVPVRAPESRGPHRRRRRRARSEGSDLGYTLIDSSDEDAPFAVPTRRVALVPEPEDTSQSFPDMHRTSSQGAEPHLSVDPTHVDSNSASQVDESLLDALENDLQPPRRRFRRVHLVSESVALCTEGPFAPLSSELEEACPSFEATTVPASSNAVRSAHRICTDTESSTEVVEPIPVHNNGGDVNHRRQRRRLVVYQPQTEPIVPDVPDSHVERLQRVREAIWQESHNMPREVRRVRDMVMRLVDRVGHVDHSAGVIPREIHRQQWSFLNIPLMWAASTGDRSNVVCGWLRQHRTRPSRYVERVCQAIKQ